MTLHIIKLAVGADTVEDIRAWQDWLRQDRAGRGLDPRPVCDTRNTPKRRDEVLDGGSLYWVVKGLVLVRQRIVDIVTLDTGGGETRCELVLDGELQKVAPVRKKAFQGWRYLPAGEAPADLAKAGGSGELPDELRRTLIDLGAW